MKKVLIIFALVSMALTSQSQVLITLLLGDKINSDKLEFGLEGGFNWSKIAGFETQSYHRDWNLGFYFVFKMNQHWYFNTGVLVKSKMGVAKLTSKDLNAIGASMYNSLDDTKIEGDYSQQMSTFIVPILARYKFGNNMYVELGPQLSLMYKSWVEFESDIEGKDAIIKEYNKDKLNKLDAGMAIGAGYTLFKGTGWTFGAKYYYGFVNVYKGMPGTNNSAFFIKMNIPIGAGEKAQQKAAEKAAKKRAKKEAKQMKKE
jgi:hypothetical protein